MNALLVYPECPKSYWSLHHALKFISKRTVYPPLGLLTVAAMLPAGWRLRLADMNVRRLRDADLRWAGIVLISAMSVQRESAVQVARRCRNLGVRTVAGGPLFFGESHQFDVIDHILLGEAELTLPDFLADLERGAPRRLYEARDWADLQNAPVPRWDLVDWKKYASMNIQFSRGCPFDCDFCGIPAMFGHRPRTKTAGQVLRELDALYGMGWRGGVFFVDDNFIGNQKVLKQEILPALVEWSARRKYPFSFSTEASVNLSDDAELMALMARAGFTAVFIGIETPSEEGLAECNKRQNRNRDLLACVKKMQRAGLEVQGGFIVGFDNDNPSVFRRMVEFIQLSGILSAMVGLLNAPKGTRLYRRLAGENRILDEFSGDNTDLTMNFVPKMERTALLGSYQAIVNTIYAPRPYYDRLIAFLKEYRPVHTGRVHPRFYHLTALVRSVVRLGLLTPGRRYYWKAVFWALFHKPGLLPVTIKHLICGYHYRKTYQRLCSG